jgi:hypothetical protein
VDVYLPIMGLASFSAGAIILREQLERRRCRALEREARQLGFSFMRVAEPFEASAISELAVCPQESSCIETEVEELIQGMISGRQVFVFNLRAHSSFGEGSTVTTFAAFQSSGFLLPAFQVRAKTILDRCWGWLEQNPADFAPDFTKRFLLRCPDDGKRREFFTLDKQVYLRQLPDHFQIRSGANWLLIFRPGGIVSPSNLRQFVRVTSTIAFGLLDPETQARLSTG